MKSDHCGVGTIPNALFKYGGDSYSSSRTEQVPWMRGSQRVKPCQFASVRGSEKAFPRNRESLGQRLTNRFWHDDQGRTRAKARMLRRTQQIAPGGSAFAVVHLITTQEQASEPFIGMWGSHMRKGHKPSRLDRQNLRHYPTSRIGNVPSLCVTSSRRSTITSAASPKMVAS